MTDPAPVPPAPRALPDLDLVAALRSPATIFYTYDVDNGELLRAAADRIEQREAELHATDVDRLRALEEIPPLVDGLRCYAVPPADLRRLVELASTGAAVGPIGEGTPGVDVMLLLDYRELVGLEVGS